MPPSVSPTGQAALATLMTEVIAAPPGDRAGHFAAMRDAMTAYLERLGAGTPPHETARFVASAQTYLRALSTYPAASDEWLDVFRAFQQLFSTYHSVRAAPPTRAAEPAMTPTMTYVPNAGTWRT